MLLLVGTPPRLTRSISKRGEELLKSQRSNLSPVSAFPTPSSLPPVRTCPSHVSGPAFVSVTKSPPLLPSKPEPPDLVPVEQPDLPFEALSPPDPPPKAPPPPDLPNPPDELIVGSMILCWCADWNFKCTFPSNFIHHVLPFITPITAVAAATLVSLPHLLIQSSYCFVQLCLCGTQVPSSCESGSLLLKIRNISNTEVLIKGFVAMLKIVDCALVAASIPGVISLVVVSNFQGFVSLYSLMFVEIRGLLDVISCLSVLYAPILICCICFLVLAFCLAWMALFSCSINTFSIHGD
ncbi:uncharacterized protein LOC108859662 [Raphanus sativus]|uniref:Uncharacterized protein LOC108859662 n=1 Tax=Raphanus sativus TaxID=3726 RepID=A0A6J0NWP5_RAPSA|nr:uncharacterized protein LOC108859662 [Raphanus sativus]